MICANKFGIKFFIASVLSISVLLFLLTNEFDSVYWKRYVSENYLSNYDESNLQNDSISKSSQISDGNQINEVDYSKIPKQTVMSKSEMFDWAEKESNIAIKYWSDWKSYENTDEWLNKSLKICKTELPSPHLLKFSNIYWQTFINSENLTVFLYNSYYDNRENIKSVRIVGVTNNYKAFKQSKLW